MRGGVMACPWCAGPTERAQGVYLELLYPTMRFCVGCGRPVLHCDCRRALPLVTESELRAMDGNR